MFSKYIVFIYFIYFMVPNFLLALEPTANKVFKNSNGKIISKQANSKLTTNINTIKALEALNKIQPQKNSCNLYDQTKSVKEKSYGACSVSIDNTKKFTFINLDYKSLSDDDVPSFIQNFLDTNLSDKEKKELKNKELDIVVRFKSDRVINNYKKSYSSKRKLKRDSRLKEGAETEIKIKNDSSSNTPLGLVGIVFKKNKALRKGLPDGDDKGATHGLGVKYTKSLSPELNYIFEFDSSLNTEGINGDKLCSDGSGNYCQAQKFLAKTYLGGGIEKQKFNSKKNTVINYAAIAGLVERNAHKSGRFFDATKHQSGFHSFLNDILGSGSARDYTNIKRKERYDLGGYLELSASGVRNILVLGGSCMLSFSGGGDIMLESSGTRRLDLWGSAGLVYQGKNANHALSLSVGHGVHNSLSKGHIEVIENNIPLTASLSDSIQLDSGPTSEYIDDGFGVGLDKKLSFNYVYDRGSWRTGTGITVSSGEKDMSREFEDLDLTYNTSLILTPGQKSNDAFGAELASRLSRLKPKSTFIDLSFPSDEKIDDRLLLFELPISSD